MDGVFNAVAPILLCLLLLTGVTRYGVRGLNQRLRAAIETVAHVIENGLPPIAETKPLPESEKCRCATPGEPIAITVSDTLDGQSYIARRVCPKCWNVHVPKPKPPRGPGAVTLATNVAALGHTLVIGGLTIGPQPVEEPVDKTPVPGDTIDGYCGFCNREGHAAIDCTALDGSWPVPVPDPETNAYLGAAYTDPRVRLKFLLDQRGLPSKEEYAEIRALSRILQVPDRLPDPGRTGDRR